jgi:UDP-glucose 4-epimerase
MIVKNLTKTKNILVTGGAGYIGSHTCVELLQAGHTVIVADNLCNSKPQSLRRVEAICGRAPQLHVIDLRDRESLNGLFEQSKIDVVIHFAGLKAVGESVAEPLKYYQNNIDSTLVLCGVMRDHGVKKLVFSSSATVYGDPKEVPIREEFLVNPTNPYGRTKAMIEEVLKDLCAADRDWSVVLLRYFNPVGAHPSGLIGEDPNGIPNNLFPYITQVAVGRLAKLSVFGSDYATPDGTGIRDYIHVVDLAKAHVKAVDGLEGVPGTRTYNVGTGRGYSVLEVLSAFEMVVGKKIPHQIAGRRPGDVASCFADSTRANQELGWFADCGIEEMVADAWRWQQNNPNGY